MSTTVHTSNVINYSIVKPLFYSTATTPAIAMTAAAKLPTCFFSDAAFPEADAFVPDGEGERVAVATPAVTLAAEVAEVALEVGLVV